LSSRRLSSRDGPAAFAAAAARLQSTDAERAGSPAPQWADEHTVLVSVLDDDTARATRQLDGLCDRARLTPA
jgi:hypothetical protein